jgi:hypothetical protein
MFLPNNKISDQGLFYEYRKNFSDMTLNFVRSMENPDLEHNFSDFWAKAWYGKVDNEFVSVFPRPDLMREGHGVTALSFVLDAYDDFKDHFERACDRGGFDSSKLVPDELALGYVDPVAAYREYASATTGQIANNLFNRRKFANDFEGFMEEVENFIFLTWDDPVTFSGMMTSNLSSISWTGLALNLQEEDFSNDVKKFEKYFSDDLLKVYAESARRFGFLIDINAPWRLVADVNSLAMQYYMRRFEELDTMEREFDKSKNTTRFAEEFGEFAEEYTTFGSDYMEKAERLSLDYIFETFFERAHNIISDGEEILLRQVIILAWNSLLESPEYQFSHCKQKRQKKDVENIDDTYNWLKLYTKTRIKESRIKTTKNEISKLTKKVTVMKKSLASDAYLRYLNAWTVKERFEKVLPY